MLRSSMSERGPLVHPSAIVHPSALIGRGSEVGPFCIVGEYVTIGERTKLLSNVVVNGHPTIGDDCTFYPFCSIGTASQDSKYSGERAYTSIGNRTIVRQYCSINRATGEGEVTSVGDDCLLLAYVHIAHNCRVGDGVTMSNLAQLAGHVHVDDNANIGGMAGTHQFLRIGEYSMVGGATKLTRDAPPFFLVEGNPAQVYGLNSVGLRRGPVRAGHLEVTLRPLLFAAALLASEGAPAVAAPSPAPTGATRVEVSPERILDMAELEVSFDTVRAEYYRKPNPQVLLDGARVGIVSYLRPRGIGAPALAYPHATGTYAHDLHELDNEVYEAFR